MVESVLRTDDLAAQAEAQAEVDERANVGDVIEIKATSQPEPKIKEPAKEAPEMVPGSDASSGPQETTL